MRPNPDEVRAWLAGDQTDDALRDHLSILSDDPNWHVVDAPAGAARRLILTYSPTGERLDAWLWRSGDVWRPYPRP